MKRYLFLLTGLLIFLTACQPKKNMSSTEETELEKSVLWEIRHPSLPAPSYLMGTIHLIPENLYFWPEEFQQAFDQTEQITLEIDISALDPASLMGMMSSLVMPGDQTIRDLVTPDQYEIIAGYFEKTGFPFMFLERIKPFFLYFFVSMDAAGLNQGSMKSYEVELMEKAAATGKTVTGLETVDFQISLFDSIPYTYQAYMLTEAILDKEYNGKGMDEMDDIFHYYVAQDLEALHALRRKEEKEDEIMHDFNLLLIDKRNKNWIPEIEKLIREKPSFVAVGAGHLAGSAGVIRLLQESGYTLTPVKINQ